MEDDYTHKRFSNATSHLVFHWAAENEKWYQWYSITCSSIVMVPTAMAINRSFMCSPPCSKAHLSCFAFHDCTCCSSFLGILMWQFSWIESTVPNSKVTQSPSKSDIQTRDLLSYRFFLQTCLSWSKLLV